ncbi:DNA primase [Mycoplasma enhydrae]|uniref:DNA primase n=1 Tax=Mycoplasma enhydrae TaxID=2499220 RepID=UPI00197B7A88|nr:DNA primase [Mycoplasma enhydrae]MBN4089473.1 DNA primase [Mycoplasma enhydrae]
MTKENIWEFITSNVDIISVIGEYVSLQKQGKNYKACCPFHGEKTPSFIVSKDKGIFKCFGCNKSGNVIKFIEIIENLKGIEALKFLAHKNNLDISAFGSYLNSSNISSEHTKIFEVNNAALDFFKYQITFEKYGALDEFLASRNLTKSIIKEFEIGFAPKNKSIYDKLKELNFESFAIFNSSLISSHDNVNFFNDRLIFPIHDKFGNVVAFSGRDITNQSDPKYLNSSETIVFKKNEVMFNYYHAKEEIIKTNEVYLVEGQFDCIALYRIDIKNAVAIMGTSLSAIHLKELSNRTINLFFDNDTAGINATLKNLRIILYYAQDYKLNVNFINNTLNKDPDDLYKLYEGKTLRQIALNKIDIVEYLYNSFKKIHDSNISESKKFEKYKILFEYIYYINKQLVITLQNKLAENKIIESKLFESYLKDFAKPNFPSDKYFISKLKEYKKSSSEQKQTKQNSIDSYFNVDATNLNVEALTPNAQINDPKLNNLKFKSIELKKRLSPHWNLLNDILIATLSQPNFAQNFTNEQFHFLTFDEIVQPTRELISYIIAKSKKGTKISIDNIIPILEEDIKKTTNDLLKNKYSQYLAEAQTLKNIALNNQSILEKDVYDQKIKELIEQKHKHNPKELITKKG